MDIKELQRIIEEVVISMMDKSIKDFCLSILIRPFLRNRWTYYKAIAMLRSGRQMKPQVPLSYSTMLLFFSKWIKHLSSAVPKACLLHRRPCTCLSRWLAIKQQF